jgi:starch phosphorylase
MVFVEGYDMAMAKSLVQGADIWLNTPRRPYEACGTSGMKAALNGVLNVSILDGWWCEGYAEDRGWAIGAGEEYADPAYQDAVESQALFNVLENEVIPCFYEKRNGGLPDRWISMMKASMKMAIEDFCSLRMVSEYENRFYLPILKQTPALLKEEAIAAKRLAIQEERLYQLWKHIRVGISSLSCSKPFRVGEKCEVTAEVHLGELLPDEVDVEVYNGRMRSVDTLKGFEICPMKMMEATGPGTYRYFGTVDCRVPGRYGFTVRATPRGDDFLKALPGLIAWS